MTESDETPPAFGDRVQVVRRSDDHVAATGRYCGTIRFPSGYKNWIIRLYPTHDNLMYRRQENYRLEVLDD